MRRAAIYCRISRDTEHNGLGVERQERECRTLCRAHDFDIADVFIDNDISAYNIADRPGSEPSSN